MGSGTWDLSSSNWWTGASTTWANSAADTAVFGAGGTAGTVTIAGVMDVGQINFNSVASGSYLLTGGTRNGLANIYIGQSGVTISTINSAITTSGALQLHSSTAGSSLNLGGAITATSMQLFDYGTYTLSGSTANSTGDIRLYSGGSTLVQA